MFDSISRFFARFSTPGGVSIEQVIGNTGEVVPAIINTVSQAVGGVPVIGQAFALLSIAGIFEFKTHRPDSDELEPGTQWLDGTPDAGVLRYWPGGRRGIDWTGEILATSPGNIPIGCWDYDRQVFDPITAISRQGICVFRPKNEIAERAEEDRGHARRIFSDSEINAARAEAESRGYTWE